MTMTPRPRHRAAGFTLVELMVAIALSGVVLGFVFQIHTQMVGALRGQANLSEVVESVTAAREMMTRELRLAGMGFPPSGVQYGPDAVAEVWHGVEAVNDNDGGGADIVDELTIERVDGDVYSTIAADGAPTWTFAIPNANALGFSTAAPVFLYNKTQNKACAPVPSLVDPTGITVDDAEFTAGACRNFAISIGDTEQVSLLRRVSFRLDPAAARLEMGVLQRAENGGAWEDIGIGYTNLQLAIRFVEPADGVDADGDGDPVKDWYSADNMEITSNARPVNGVPVQVGLSIEGRNLRRLDNLSSSATPAYIDLAAPDNNPLGNFGQACAGAQYDPCGVPDLASTVLPRYVFPDHVYRSTSTTVYLRSRLESL